MGKTWIKSQACLRYKCSMHEYFYSGCVESNKLKAMIFFLIFIFLSLCGSLKCAATGHPLETSGNLKLFTVDVQSEMAEFWQAFLSTMTELFAKLKPDEIAAPRSWTPNVPWK